MRVFEVLGIVDTRGIFQVDVTDVVPGVEVSGHGVVSRVGSVAAAGGRSGGADPRTVCGVGSAWLLAGA